MWCGSNDSLEIHEIERRGQAERSWGNRCNYLKLCHECHDGPFANMSHERQLAAKMVADPDNFDLSNWLRIKDPDLKAPQRITFGDIARHLKTDSPFNNKPIRRML